MSPAAGIERAAICHAGRGSDAPEASAQPRGPKEGAGPAHIAAALIFAGPQRRSSLADTGLPSPLLGRERTKGA